MNSSTLGVVPKLLPVTATFAGPLILLNTYLQVQCVLARIRSSVSMGESSATTLSDNPATKASVTIDGTTGGKMYNDPVLSATTAHRNFIENVPLAMILAGLVELNGGNRRTLTGAMATLVVARMCHAYGIANGQAALAFRQAGFFGSTGFLLGISGWAAYLVKGYWGL